MPVNETDLELLETYLDSELPVSEAEGLWRRLSAEPELAATLNELRAGRAARLNIWESMEPTDQVTAAVSRNVARSVRRENLWDWAHRGLVYVAAAAACILLGFGGGWVSRVPTQAMPGLPAGNVAMNNPPVMNTNSTVSSPNGYAVAIRDQTGNIIAMPRFDTQQEAVEFVNDLGRAQARQSSGDLGSNVIRAANEQF